MSDLTLIMLSLMWVVILCLMAWAFLLDVRISRLIKYILLLEKSAALDTEQDRKDILALYEIVDKLVNKLKQRYGKAED